MTAEFFDIGCSRRLPWSARPQAAASLEELSALDRRFDAVVIGEYERAFYGEQLSRVTPLMEVFGVHVWLPEVGGRVDLGDPMHRVLLTMLGAQSQREVLRSRHRVLAAMRAQASGQGRYLGGRPPYGYRLVDAGSHPNRADVAWGRRLRRLDPDPSTAPHVKRIFEQRLAGRSVSSIARALNEQMVPCPSHVDSERNRHRTGEVWTLRTVAVILANPRYTGRQVWNRQRTEREGNRVLHRRNRSDEWAVSSAGAHPALVSEADFVEVQQVRASRPTKDGAARTYLLAGLMRCGLCGRRMDSHWVNGRPGYRCRHGHSSTQSRQPSHLKNIYVREDVVLDELVVRLTRSSAGNDLGCRGNDGTSAAAPAIVGTLRAEGLMVFHDATGTQVRRSN